MQSTQPAACASCAIAHHGEHVLEMLGKLSLVPRRPQTGALPPSCSLFVDFSLTVTADFVCMQSTQPAACASCAIAHHGEHVLEMLGELSLVPRRPQTGALPPSCSLFVDFSLTVTADFVCMQSTQPAACASCTIAHHGEHVLEMLGKLSLVPCGSRRQKLWVVV
jgi:Zn-finger protein